MYKYINQVHSSTGLKPFEILMSRDPPNPTMKSLPTAFKTDRTTEITRGKFQEVLLRKLEHMTTKIEKILSKAKQH